MPNTKTTEEINKNIVVDLQIKMAMVFIEQGLIKEAENKLKEFGLPKKEIEKLFKENSKYIKIMKEKQI